MARRVLILGAPGAGKGTQSKRIAEEFDVQHVATGDIFRANKDMETSHGTPREYMERGELVPDPVVNEMVADYLADVDGYVLDGYPRSLNQAEFLEETEDLDVVLYLDVSEEELVRRLTGRRVCPECGASYHVQFNPPEEAGVCDECGARLIQREDDTEETVRNRLAEYDEKTRPVVEFYRDHDGFVAVDGEQELDEVWADIREAVAARTE